MNTPRVSQFTIGRLFNLGSYEHIRYEVRVEVPEGASAGETLTRVEKLIGRLVVKPPVEARDILGLEQFVAQSDADIENSWRRGSRTVAELREEVQKEIDEKKNARAAWEAYNAKIRGLLDQLGEVSEKFTDAKLNWEEPDSDF